MAFSEFVSWIQIFNFEYVTLRVLTHITSIAAGNRAQATEEVECVHLAVVSICRCHLI